MAKLVPLLASVLVLPFVSFAIAQPSGFPCDAFQMQPNGMLAVVKPVTIRGANAVISMNPGMSFGPDVMTMGLNVYENYRKYCHAEQSPGSSSK